jgi:hypothetical protein
MCFTQRYIQQTSLGFYPMQAVFLTIYIESFLPIGWRIFCLMKKPAKMLSAEAACNPHPFGGHQTTLQTQNV